MGSGISAALDMIYTDRSLCGIGEFPDLKILLDWAVQANLLLIQLGPVQDANFSFGPEEAPPDGQVSAFAFDSIYLALRQIGDAGEAAPDVAGERCEIARLKMRHLRTADESINREGVRSQAEFREFVEANKFWLPPYCAWCAVRDRPPAESAWPKFDAAPDLLCGEFASPHFDAQFFHAWVQQHCHRQLADISACATQHRVAWTTSRGSASPVQSTISTPACSTDRSLFRCWNIPANTDSPLFGHFVPSIPIDLKDLQNMHITDVSRLCRPVFPINDLLAFPMPESKTEWLINALATSESGVWRARTCGDSDRRSGSHIHSAQMHIFRHVAISSSIQM
jgi:hypothetical protein